MNNHGWGLREQLIISASLLIALLLVSSLIFALYNRLDVEKGSKYFTLEEKLKIASVKYVSENNVKNEGYITLKELKENDYIDIFQDSNYNDCDGYVIYKDSDYKSYISCEFYKTKNFDEKYLN